MISFHGPTWMQERLEELARKHNMSVGETMRRVICAGLTRLMDSDFTTRVQLLEFEVKDALDENKLT